MSAYRNYFFLNQDLQKYHLLGMLPTRSIFPGMQQKPDIESWTTRAEKIPQSHLLHLLGHTNHSPLFPPTQPLISSETSGMTVLQVSTPAVCSNDSKLRLGWGDGAEFKKTGLFSNPHNQVDSRETETGDAFFHSSMQTTDEKTFAVPDILSFHSHQNAPFLQY